MFTKVGTLYFKEPGLKSLKYFLFPMLIGAAIISCGKSKHSSNPSSSPLYGSWQSVSLVVSGCSNSTTNHSTNDCCGVGALCCNQLVFTSTTMTTTGVTGTSSSSYTISGSSLHYPSDGGVPTTFTIDGNTLTLTYQQTAANGNCLIVSTYTKI